MPVNNFSDVHEQKLSETANPKLSRATGSRPRKEPELHKGETAAKRFAAAFGNVMAADDDHSATGTAPIDSLRALVFVHVPRETTNETFVALENAVRTDDTAPTSDRRTQPMAHEPRAFSVIFNVRASSHELMPFFAFTTNQRAGSHFDRGNGDSANTAPILAVTGWDRSENRPPFGYDCP